MWLEAAVVFALVVINGFFAMSELALVSSRRAELKRLAERGRHGALVALELIADPSRMLAAVQIGITVVGIAAGAYSGATLGRQAGLALDDGMPWLRPWGDEVAMVLVVGATTYLSLVIGELVPKRLALRRAEAIASRVAPAMHWVAKAGAPLVWLLGVSTGAVMRAFGLKDGGATPVSEDEVRALIAEGVLTGVFAPHEKRMLDRVLRLDQRTVASIMTPRPDIIWLDLASPPEEMRARIAAAPHSRFPLGKGTFDDLAGVLDIRRVAAQLLAGKPFDPLTAMAQPLVVHETTQVPRLLEMFSGSGAGMAVVVDEYGTIQGIATLTDILEAIAGELPTPEGAPAVRRDDGSWLLDGGLGIDEAESVIGLYDLGGEGDYNTVAGFVLDRLHHLPEVGERLAWRGWCFEVIDMDGRRIDKVLAVPPTEPEKSAE